MYHSKSQSNPGLFIGLVLVLISIPLHLAQAQAPVSDGDKIVFSLGNRKMTAAEFNKLIVTLPPQYASSVNTSGAMGLLNSTLTF